jgi:hypothetical protein
LHLSFFPYTCFFRVIQNRPFLRIACLRKAATHVGNPFGSVAMSEQGLTAIFSKLLELRNISLPNEFNVPRPGT